MSVKQENINDDTMIDTEIIQNEANIASTVLENEAMDIDGSAIADSAVQEDESDAEDYDEEDDPVVKSIPINLNTLAYPINVFQYPTKPKKLLGTRTELPHPSIAAVRLKPNSKQWEMEVPLEQNVFFDKEGSEEKWPNANIENQVLTSVTVSENGQYVAFYRDEQLYLLPVESFGQFRPLFKHIDSQNGAVSATNAPTNGANSSGTGKTTVVTMSVKSSAEANQNRLGGALLAQKISEEETFKDLQWVDHTFEQFMETVMTEESKKKVENASSKEDYFAKLL
ncbi:hypothetical protein ACO0RG_004511 [Hanseniaspora osmophila]